MYKEIFAENDAFMNYYRIVKPLIQGLMAKGKKVGIEPEDLEADLMLKLFKITKTYDKERGAQFATYAITCLKNEYKEIISQHMAKKRCNGTFDLSLDSVPDNTEDSKSSLMDYLAAKGDDPFEECWKKECNAAIKSFFVNYKDEKIRGILHLSYQGVKQCEVAKQYGCAQSLVSFYINKFKKELRAYLVEEGYIDA